MNNNQYSWISCKEKVSILLFRKDLIALIAAFAPGIVVNVGMLYSKAARLKYASSWSAWEPTGVLIIKIKLFSLNQLFFT